MFSVQNEHFDTWQGEGGSFYFSGLMFKEQICDKNENPVGHHKPPQNLDIVEKKNQAGADYFKWIVHYGNTWCF